MTKVTAKLSLSAPAVRELIGPEVEAEITTRVTAQIAEALSRKWRKDTVDQKATELINACIAKAALVKEPFYGLTTSAKATVDKHLREVVEKTVTDAFQTKAVQLAIDQIRAAVDRRAGFIADSLDANVMKLIDQKVDQRVNAILSVAGRLRP